jgi:serine/threonine-protein kinase
VYRAHDLKLGRPVALKLVLGGGGAEEVARLQREARAAAVVSHPNVIVVHDVGEIDGSAFVAMELVAGRPLRSFVGDESVSIERRLKWLAQIARGLAAAHRRGVVHRDVKPENVIVRDEDDVAKVLDFGIARAFYAAEAQPDSPTEDVGLGTITRGAALIGTPLYMAPEQLRAEAVDARADQFAWGVLAYELLAGRYPWPVGNIVQLAATITSTPPAPLSGGGSQPIDAAAEEAVLRALAADRERRFPSLDEAANAIDPVQTHPRPTIEASSVVSKPAPVPRRAIALSAAAALARS